MKGIVFDMDDTLVNSVSAHMASIKDTVKKFNLPMKWEEIRLRFGKKFNEVIKEVYGITDEKLLFSMKKEKEKNFKKYINLVKLMPGAEEILKYSKNNFKTALASMGLRSDVELIINHLNISKYFDVVISGNGLPSRPSPIILIIACKKLKIKPGNCISIGDSIYGIGSAHKIGMNFIGVSTGIFDKLDLKKAGADFVVNDLFEALELIKEIKKIQDYHSIPSSADLPFS